MHYRKGPLNNNRDIALEESPVLRRKQRIEFDPVTPDKLKNFLESRINNQYSDLETFYQRNRIFLDREKKEVSDLITSGKYPQDLDLVRKIEYSLGMHSGSLISFVEYYTKHSPKSL